MLIYCSDYFSNSKGLILVEIFAVLNFAQNLWDLLSGMVKVIFANDLMGRNARDKFLQITNF